MLFVVKWGSCGWICCGIEGVCVETQWVFWVYLGFLGSSGLSGFIWFVLVNFVLLCVCACKCEGRKV